MAQIDAIMLEKRAAGPGAIAEFHARRGAPRPRRAGCGTVLLGVKSPIGPRFKAAPDLTTRRKS